MNNITKYNLKTAAISVSGLILLLCVMAYLTDSQIDKYFWSSINPLGFLEGVVFTLGFGFGVPIWLSVIVIGLILFMLFMAFLWGARKVMK